jgi:TetR/AcrR family transcriptional regulator
MSTRNSKPESPRARNAAASRGAILAHAIAEFAAQGVAGARTAAIAEAAGVNKALLYYYFRDKESLYSASLHEVFSGLFENVLPMLQSSLSPGEKILRLSRIHFEYLLQHPHYPRLIQQELSRARSSGEPSEEFRKIASTHFAPMHGIGLKVVRDGIDCKEFRKVAGPNILSTLLGMNVFYFISAPIVRITRGVDPFSPECVREHIASSLDFLGAALFTDRAYGIMLAKKIAASPTALPRKLRGPVLDQRPATDQHPAPKLPSPQRAKRERDGQSVQGKRATHES